MTVLATLARRFGRGHWPSPHTIEIFLGQSKVGQDRFVRDALATIQRGASGGNLGSLLLQERLIIQWSAGKAARDWIGHDLQQAHDDLELRSVETIQQLVRLLFRGRH